MEPCLQSEYPEGSSPSSEAASNQREAPSLHMTADIGESSLLLVRGPQQELPCSSPLHAIALSVAVIIAGPVAGPQHSALGTLFAVRTSCECIP